MGTKYTAGAALYLPSLPLVSYTQGPICS